MASASWPSGSTARCFGFRMRAWVKSGRCRSTEQRSDCYSPVSSGKTNGDGPCTDLRSDYSEGVNDATAPVIEAVPELQRRVAKVEAERDQYKHHYLTLLE